MAAPRPLDGITVVALEQAVAAPFCTRQLADMGARVVKIERPDGGDFARGYDTTVRGYSSFFVWLNRSKRSLALDVKRAEARAVLERLLARADVFVQNLAPGAAERLGLGAADLAARFPRLVVCNISGYGSTGPYRDQKAYDLLIQAESGFTAITGSPDAPAKAGISICDIAGGMYGFAAIALALFERERTGRGRVLEVSLFDAMAEWMSAPAYATLYGGRQPPRAGLRHNSIYPYGPVPTPDDGEAGGAATSPGDAAPGDAMTPDDAAKHGNDVAHGQPGGAGNGGRVMLAVQNEREWERLCREVLRRPELVDDPRFATNEVRSANRAALDAIMAVALQTYSAAEVADLLESAGIAHSRINDLTGLLEHPQLSERQRWIDVPMPAGPIRCIAPPIIMDDEPTGIPAGPIPAVGEHSAGILAELGYSADEIATLCENGVIAGP